MSLAEFELIEKYFSHLGTVRSDVVLGSGDDAAILNVPKDESLVVSIDTLVSGIHFPENTSPQDIGYKSLAVSLSDLAAMGATPAWITASLTIPSVDEKWLTGFSDGFNELLKAFDCQLVGGDLSRGPLSISVQVHGFVPEDKALRRDGAQVADKIYVTDFLGDAGLALKVLKGEVVLDVDDDRYVMKKLDRPMPNIKEGLALRGVANSAIDLSDGLMGDLNHILDRSKVGGRIDVEKLPLSPVLQKYCKEMDAWELALSAGDDFCLCFTASGDVPEEFYCIGEIESEAGLRLMHQDKLIEIKKDAYQHF